MVQTAIAAPIISKAGLFCEPEERTRILGGLNASPQNPLQRHARMAFCAPRPASASASSIAACSASGPLANPRFTTLTLPVISTLSQGQGRLMIAIGFRLLEQFLSQLF